MKTARYVFPAGQWGPETCLLPLPSVSVMIDHTDHTVPGCLWWTLRSAVPGSVSSACGSAPTEGGTVASGTGKDRSQLATERSGLYPIAKAEAERRGFEGAGGPGTAELLEIRRLWLEPS